MLNGFVFEFFLFSGSRIVCWQMGAGLSVSYRSGVSALEVYSFSDLHSVCRASVFLCGEQVICF